jgi:hypothetical protein
MLPAQCPTSTGCKTNCWPSQKEVEEGLSRPVDPSHGQADVAFPDSVIAGERRELHAFWVLTVMFFPEELPGHSFPVQFPVNVGPVRLGTGPTGHRIGFLEEQDFQLEVCQSGR